MTRFFSTPNQILSIFHQLNSLTRLKIHFILLYRAIHKLHRQARGQGDLQNVYACLRGGRGSHRLVYVDKFGLYIFEYMTKNSQNIPIFTYFMRVHRIVKLALAH